MLKLNIKSGIVIDKNSHTSLKNIPHALDISFYHTCESAEILKELLFNLAFYLTALLCGEKHGNLVGQNQLHLSAFESFAGVCVYVYLYLKCVFMIQV